VFTAFFIRTIFADGLVNEIGTDPRSHERYASENEAQSKRTTDLWNRDPDQRLYVTDSFVLKHYVTNRRRMAECEERRESACQQAVGTKPNMEQKQ
jgi:hypothetical protein